MSVDLNLLKVFVAVATQGIVNKQCLHKIANKRFGYF